jgi:hypothetical protein
VALRRRGNYLYIEVKIEVITFCGLHSRVGVPVTAKSFEIDVYTVYIHRHSQRR